MEGNIAALFGDSMFHSLTAANEDGIDDKYECIEFGQESQEEI